MANLKIITTEEITIDGEKKSSYFETSISGVSNISERTISVPTGSDTTLFSFSNTEGAGTFLTGSLKYARITNLSVSHSIILRVSSSNENINFDVVPGGSFLLSSAQITGSVEGGANPLLGYDNIASIKCEPSSSDCRVEYFLVTS